MSPGERYGKLTAIKKVFAALSAAGNRSNRWLFKCDCGELKVHYVSNVRSGDSLSCGCDLRAEGEAIRVGETFNHWTIVAYSGKRKFGSGAKRAFVRCRCSCGAEQTLDYFSVIYGHTKKCKNHPPEVRGLGACMRVFRDYRTNARKRGLTFELTPAEFFRISQLDCAYCGLAPGTLRRAERKNDSPFLYNGVDRIDSGKGYVDGNMVPCCCTCNRAKLDSTQEDFFRMVKRIYERHKLNEK